MSTKPSHHTRAAQPRNAMLEHPTHCVQFYSDDTFLTDTLSRFMGSALGAGDAAVVIATEPHRKDLTERLLSHGINLEMAVEQGRYLALDASETLSQFLVNGWPDEARFLDLMGGVISRAKAAAAKQHGRTALFGEMVALLWREGRTEAALRLEQLWNQIAHSHDFSLVCAYPLSSFYRDDQGEAFLKICDEHSGVLPAESYSLASEEERLRMVAQWQQKALALELEVARRHEAYEASARLAAIVESSEDAIASKDLNGVVTSWNAAAEKMFGYTAEEIVGKPITLIIPPELQQDEQMILGKIRRGERIEHFETVRQTKDGNRKHVSLTISPMRDAVGRIMGAAKIVRDITDRKRTEEALRQAEKMAATGQLAASIAHEINNPMQALTNLLALIGYKAGSNEEARKIIRLAEEELRRMAHITRQMLAFYQESATPVPVRITEAIEDVLELFAVRLRTNHIRLERRYEFDEPIPAFPVELHQLLANLLSNAIEAITLDGRIVIRVAAGRDFTRPERRGVRILIADSGPGIDPRLRQRIFEPFFTTKAERGTGLGLWVVKGIVTKHEGSIRMRSSTLPRRSGTIFSVFLPIPEAWTVLPDYTIAHSETAA